MGGRAGYSGPCISALVVSHGWLPGLAALLGMVGGAREAHLRMVRQGSREGLEIAAATEQVAAGGGGALVRAVSRRRESHCHSASVQHAGHKDLHLLQPGPPPCPPFPRRHLDWETEVDATAPSCSHAPGTSKQIDAAAEGGNSSPRVVEEVEQLKQKRLGVVKSLAAWFGSPQALAATLKVSRRGPTNVSRGQLGLLCAWES